MKLKYYYKFAGVSLFVLILALLFLLIYPETRGRIQPYLDIEYIPTAEYLLEHPLALPNSMIGVSHQEVGNLQKVCVSISHFRRPDLTSDEIRLYTQIFLNKKRLNNMQDMSFSEDIAARFCFTVRLNLGIHLLEIRLRETSANEYLETYQFAFQVE